MVFDAASKRAAAVRLLGQRDLSSAVVALRGVAEASNDPEDRLLLGRIAYVAIDFDEAQRQLELAYREFQSRGLARRAAMAATSLGSLYFDGLEDQVVGRGWLARAVRLLEQGEPCVEKGYALLGLMGASVASADELDANARVALDLAQRFADRDLECKALGDSGLALVSMGRIRDGMARLDEACTMIAARDCTDPSVISQVMCGLLSACDRSGDVVRAEAWLRYIERSTSDQHEGPAIHILAHCWSAFGSVLCQVGRWHEAEMALRMGLARGATSFQHLRLSTRAALADLWIRQGRLDGAARLLDHSVDRVEILGPCARLYLAQRRFDFAAAAARQALRQLSGDHLRSSALLLVLVEAELGQGNVDAAADAAARLQQLATHAEVPVPAAQAALALGKTAMAQAQLELAVHLFEAGLAALPGDMWPLLRAPLHLELARAHISRASAEANVNAQAALSIYQRVGAPEASIAADLLRSLGGSPEVAPSPPTPLDVLTPREYEVLSLLGQGMTNPAIAAQLVIAPKTAEHHVSSILGKLGLRNRAQAAAYSASLRILEPLENAH